MTLFSLIKSRTRRKQEDSSLSLQIQVQHMGSSTAKSSPISPRAGKRLRKHPTFPVPQYKANVEESRPSTMSASSNRGTLGGFCAVNDLGSQQIRKPEQKPSVMKSVGRKIGLGLRLQIQSESPTDLAHVVDGTESWYLSYPPPTPTSPSTSPDTASEIEDLDEEPSLDTDAEDYVSYSSSSSSSSSSVASFMPGDDILSLRSASSIYEFSAASSAFFIGNGLKNGAEVGVDSLIESAQLLAEQYRALLSREPTPNPYLFQLPLPSPLHSNPFTPSQSDILTPLPLHITQHPHHSQTRKQKRPARRLSQKPPPNIPQRQHFKPSPSMERTIRKVKARHSLHKFIDDQTVFELHEPFFKRSRLSECSTLVSSKENTPMSSPRGRKTMEAFPQHFDFIQDAIYENCKTPEVPARSEKRPRSNIISGVRCVDEQLRRPWAVYDFADVADRRMGGVECEVWI